MDAGEETSVSPPLNIRGFIASGLESGLSARTMNLKLAALSSYFLFDETGIDSIKSR